MKQIYTFIFAIFLLVQPATASGTEGYPALFHVTGVAATDTLNIRAQDDATAPIIGALAPDTRDVEVIHLNNAGTWGRVNTAEQSGWISMQFMHRSTDPMPVRGCVGTEPFWAVTLTPDGGGVWSTPEVMSQLAYGAPIQSSNHLYHSAIEGVVAANPPQSFTMVMQNRACSDGMSDRYYGISVDLLLRPQGAAQQLYSGCCSLAP